jgi:hypothetical protein
LIVFAFISMLIFSVNVPALREGVYCESTSAKVAALIWQILSFFIAKICVVLVAAAKRPHPHKEREQKIEVNIN